MGYTEQRRHPRLPVLVDCRIEGASGRAQMRLTDLSPVGCYVDTPMQFPAGAPVTIYAKLGEGEVKLTGRVVPMKPVGSGFGLEFVDLDAAARQRLDAFIQQATA